MRHVSDSYFMFPCRQNYTEDIETKKYTSNRFITSQSLCNAQPRCYLLTSKSKPHTSPNKSKDGHTVGAQNKLQKHDSQVNGYTTGDSYFIKVYRVISCMNITNSNIFTATTNCVQYLNEMVSTFSGLVCFPIRKFELAHDGHKFNSVSRLHLKLL